MTEQDWQTCTDPKEMLHFMATAGTSYRKLRLYRCGCLRQIWDHLDFNQRSDVQTGEARADQIRREAWPNEFEEAADVPVENDIQVSLLRDVFANPFCPVSVDKSWLSPNVAVLANHIYDERLFDCLLPLSIALNLAGCDDDQILGHCQKPGPHVRGCWVVDLILNKK